MSGSTDATLPEVTVTATRLPVSPPPPAATSAQLWLRKLSLIVADQAGNGRELVVPVTPEGDALHVVFAVKQLVTSTPGNLSARIYNLSNDTAKYIASVGRTLEQAQSGNDFASANGQVVLKAGYQGNYGTIFQGSIRQIRTGRETPTDTYVDIFAADSDLARNWGFVNTALSAGYSQKDVTEACVKYMSSFGTKSGTPPTVASNTENTIPVKPPTSSPRGRAVYGTVKDILRDVAAAHDNTWSIDNGTLNFLPRTAYNPGDAVMLNSHTGMIGMPQLTADGVRVRCLLNPAIGVGTRLQINNADIQQPQINLGFTAKNYFPTTAADGIYKVLTVDHTGDNRGQNWYSDVLCISVDPSGLPAPDNVKNLALGIPP